MPAIHVCWKPCGHVTLSAPGRVQEADMPQQVPVANGQMTDLERQYFGHTQAPSSESSDSSSDSDQESLNAASEDDDDDGLDHF